MILSFDLKLSVPAYVGLQNIMQMHTAPVCLALVIFFTHEWEDLLNCEANYYEDKT